jgi:hypothetical protein
VFAFGASETNARRRHLLIGDSELRLAFFALDDHGLGALNYKALLPNLNLSAITFRDASTQSD